MHFSSALAVSASIFLFSSSARSAALQSRAVLSGQATFYGGNLHGGACSFSTYTLPSGVYGTALSDSNWNNSANCGACVSVAGPSGKSITAMIVDECPGCGPNHLDLFPDAFAALAEPSTGVIGVTWSYVDCPITTPLQLHDKDGVSDYWFSMQVVNSVKPVACLSVSTDGGETWTATERQGYNFFQYSSGFGTATVDVMIQNADGDEVVVRNVQVASGALITTTVNFGNPEADDPVAVSSPAPSRTPTPTPTPASTLEKSHDLTSSTPPVANALIYPSPPASPSNSSTAANVSAISSAPAVAHITLPTPSFNRLIVPTHTHKSSIHKPWTTLYKPVATKTEEAAAAQSTTTIYVYEDCKAQLPMTVYVYEDCKA